MLQFQDIRNSEHRHNLQVDDLICENQPRTFSIQVFHIEFIFFWITEKSVCGPPFEPTTAF